MLEMIIAAIDAAIAGLREQTKALEKVKSDLIAHPEIDSSASDAEWRATREIDQ